MPLPLPEGKQIHIDRAKRVPGYEMPSLEAAADHYSLSYLLSGESNHITTKSSYILHPGDVGATPPYVYHRSTSSASGYERINIKFSPEFVEPLNVKFGTGIVDTIYERPSYHFDQEYTLKVQEQFEKMLETYNSDSIYSEFLLQGMLFELLIMIYEHAMYEDESIHQVSISEPMIDAIYYMEQNYSQNIRMEDVATIAGYSPAHFSRLFQKQVGKSYSAYLTSIRVREAAKELMNSNKSITDIALETGFVYVSNMTAVFKKEIGMTPRDYRKQRK